MYIKDITMPSFPFQPNTLLRYYPVGGSHHHYTAVVLADGRVLQVKDPNKRRSKKIMFESPVAWADSLPEFQDDRKERIRHIQISEKMFQLRV
jgi:hypothetical protein